MRRPQKVADAADRREYDRARSRAVHAASQTLRERHQAEYAELLTAELRRAGLA